MSTPTSYDAPFLRDVVTQTTECILTVDQSGDIVFANTAVEELFGYTPDELVERGIETLFGGTDGDPLDDIRRVAGDGSSSHESESRRVTVTDRTGRSTTAFFSAEPIEHEGVRYYTVTIQEALRDERTATDDAPEDLLATVLAHSNEPIVAFDGRGRTVVDCTEPAGDRLGFERPSDAVGHSASDIFPSASDQFAAVCRRARESERAQSAQLERSADDEKSVPTEVTVSQAELDDREWLLVTLRDERDGESGRDALEKRTAAIEASIDGIAILDSDWTFEYVNGSHAELYGYEDASQLVGNSWRCLYGETETRRIEEQVRPEVERTGSWRGETVGERSDGTTFPQELSLRSLDGGGLVCVVRDISDRKHRTDLENDWLRRLNDVSHDLMEARRVEAIAEICLETATELFDCDVACLRLIDDETNDLDVAAATDKAIELMESSPACDLEGTFAGRAYRQSEILLRSADEFDALTETPLAASGHVPVGDFGVLTVACTSSASFSDVDIEGVKMLAANVAAALNRARRETELREQAESERSHRDQLETLNQINSVVHGLVGDLFQAESREAIAQRVCDGLVASSLYDSAWVGEQSVAGDGLSLSAAAGVDEDHLAADRLPVDAVANGTVREAVQTGTVASDRRYQVADREGIESPDTVEATAAVPIQYDDRVFGVIVVNATHEDAFETIGTDALDVLGDIVGFSLSATEHRELLLSDETVQLEFEVTDTSCLAVAVTEELGCYCQIRRTIKSNDGAYLSYVRLKGATGAEARRVVGGFDAVLDCRVVTDRSDGCLLEVKRATCGLETMLDYGATMRQAAARDGVGTLLVEAPQSAAVREVVDAYKQYNPDSELVAKRDVEQPVQTAAEFRSAIEDELTEKQRMAIASAYYSGYYEWPRESNGEEIAESMGISSATLHQHLRSAHRQLLGSFLEDEYIEPRGDHRAGLTSD